MMTFPRAGWVWSLFMTAACASAQVSPPGAGAGAASDAAPSTVTLSPPPSAPVIETSNERGPLSPLRPSQSLTLNVYMGDVASEPIFANDLFRPIDEKLRRAAQTAANIDAFRKTARAIIESELDARITDALIISQAKRSLTKEEQARVEVFLSNEYDRLKTASGGSRAAIDKAMAAKGLTVEKYLADLRKGAMKEIFLNRNPQRKVAITWQMAHDAYEKDPQKWQQIGEVELYTITLPVVRWLRDQQSDGTFKTIENPTPAQIKNAEELALQTGRQIVEKIKANADFATLVEDYNSKDEVSYKGGFYGTIRRGSMKNTTIENYAFTLTPNSVGAPLLIRGKDVRDSAVVVVKIGKKTDSRTFSFSEAEAQIRKNLADEQLAELRQLEFNKVLSGPLPDKLKQMLPVAVDAAVARYATK